MSVGASNDFGDRIEGCLQLRPLPESHPKAKLNVHHSIFKSIWASVAQALAPKSQLVLLCSRVAHLICSLWESSGSDSAGMGAYWKDSLADFKSFLEEVSSFVQKRSAYGFLPALFVREESVDVVGAYFERLDDITLSFQPWNTKESAQWKSLAQQSVIDDETALDIRLTEIESEQPLLEAVLDLGETNILAMMAALKKRVSVKKGRLTERQFYEHCLRYLSNYTDDAVELNAWTITSFDVEFGPKIGTGGFGVVYQGRWNGRRVALKGLNNELHVAPRVAAIRREVETWSMLQHSNILEFLGANLLDEKPFIVMPYLKNGNARDYLHKFPNSSRLSIMQNVSTGLVYLHSKHIVHGDLKGTNILIEHNGNAVLCDFGLSRLKADVNTRTADTSPIFLGSQNWMAPELFRGGSLRYPCDIYSFGMTIYEIFTNETPLGTVPTMEALRKLVVEEDIRPERPEPEEAPQLTEDIWKLAQRCWTKEASKRPSATAVERALSGSAPSMDVPKETIHESRPTPTKANSRERRIQPSESSVETEAIVPVGRRPSLVKRIFSRRRKTASESDAVFSVPPPIPEKEPLPARAVPSPPIEKVAAQSRVRRSASTMKMSGIFGRRSILPVEENGEIKRQPLVFSSPYTRCMSLDHTRDVALLSMSSGGRYLAVGLVVDYVEVWDIRSGSVVRVQKIHILPGTLVITQPHPHEAVRMAPNPIVALDLQDTVAGRFLVSATRDFIRVRESVDVMRAQGNQWEGRQGVDAPDLLDVQFQGGEFCDSVGIVNVEHLVRRVSRYERGKNEQKKEAKLGGLNPVDRTAFLWPRRSEVIFIAVRGGDILQYDAHTGQEYSQPLVFHNTVVERTLPASAGVPNADGTAQEVIQDGRADDVPQNITNGSTVVPANCVSMAFYSKTKKLAACYDNGEIRIWDTKARSHKVLRPPQTGIYRIHEYLFPIAFVPPSTFGSSDSCVIYPSLVEEKTLVFQDFDDGEVLTCLIFPECPSGKRMKDILVSPDKKKRRLVISFEDCAVVKIWCWDL